jgi:hypothetical protein
MRKQAGLSNYRGRTGLAELVLEHGALRRMTMSAA